MAEEKKKRIPLTEEEKKQRKNTRQKEYDKETGYAAQIKYQKEKMKPYTIRISTVTEQDIIDQLDKQESKAGYVKRLIREDIERSKNK